VGRIDDFNV